MNRSQIFAQYENTDAELIALDVLAGNITAFRADFNDFSEMVISDGRVIRRREQPGGIAKYGIVQNFVGDEEGKDAYMDEAGEWTEPTPDTLINWLMAVEQ
jgi:hypothetical protein